MSSARKLRDTIKTRLAAEVGTIAKEASQRVALVYPSPYQAAMSSLGFQTIYREINNEPGWSAERAFLPDPTEGSDADRVQLCCYESGRPVADFSLVAFSVAYELEIAGLVQALALSGLPPLAAERASGYPLVICGGPLTYANPLPLAPFADAIFIGEADQSIHEFLQLAARCRDREHLLETAAGEIRSCYVPSIHGQTLPAREQCPDHFLPAYAAICTPYTELTDMFLIEAVRGCPRRCAYCVMGTASGQRMRTIPIPEITRHIPEWARRVGLVGAGVSDHPQIVELVERLASQGRQVGMSSMRPERLDERLLAALANAGGRTLTTALDASSQRLRDKLGRGVREEHLRRAASLSRTFGYKRVKLYMMVGVPDERDEDLDELVEFARELSGIHPLTLAIAPFVAKKNTPLDGQPFVGIKNAQARIRKLRVALGSRVELRPTSARWAWVEYMLAQGGPAHGRAVMEAVRGGGRFSDWKRALEAVPSPSG